MHTINPLNAESNPICHLLALLGAHHILHVIRIRVNILSQLQCLRHYLSKIPTNAHTYIYIYIKVKHSHYRPGQAQRVLRKLRFPRFHDNGTGWWQVVSLTHRPSLPPENTPGTHFCQRLSRPQGHSTIGGILYQ